MRDLLILRTHRGGADVASLLAHYRETAGMDVVVAADESAGPVALPAADKVAVDAQRLQALGLHPAPRWGHRCGDYMLYAVRVARPDYDRYWIVEPDVRLNSARAADFFAPFAADETDLLATLYGPRGPDWGNHRQIGAVRAEVYGCLFPLLRLSGRAIDHLHAERRALHAKWRALPKPLQWPNDESFVCTECHYAGFTARDLNDVGPERYSAGRGWSWLVPLHPRATCFDAPDDRAYHSVQPDDASYLARLARAADTAPKAKGALRWSLETLPVDAAATGLDTSESGYTAARALLELARVPALRETAGEAADRLFPGEGRPRIRHRRLKGPGRPGFGNSAPGDFQVDAERDLPVFPTARAAAYAANYPLRRLVFTALPKTRRLLEAPFFYQAQRAEALSLVSVPFDALARLYPLEEAPRPLIVMSIGRCGSTLVNRMIGAAGLVAISEPDTFSQAPGLNGTRPEQQDAGQARQDAVAVLRATVHSVATWAESPADRLALKLRTQANLAVAPILAAFPEARYVFVLRRRDPWVKSFATSFGHPGRDIAQILRRAVAALDALAQAGAELHIAWYEDICARPAEALAALLGPNRPLPPGASEALAAVLEADSQKGSAIARDRRADSPERTARIAASLAEFEALWPEVRPAAAIARLALPY